MNLRTIVDECARLARPPRFKGSSSLERATSGKQTCLETEQCENAATRCFSSPYKILERESLRRSFIDLQPRVASRFKDDERSLHFFLYRSRDVFTGSVTAVRLPPNLPLRAAMELFIRRHLNSRA